MIVVIAIAIVYVNKDKLVKRAVEELELYTTTNIDYNSTTIGIDNSFPHLRISANDIKIKPQDDSVTLVQLRSVTVVANLWQIIRQKDKIQLSKLEIEEPIIKLDKYQNEVSNWELITFKSDSTKTTDRVITFKEIILNDGTLIYDNHLSHTKINIEGITYEGRLKMAEDSIFQEGIISMKINTKGTALDIEDYKVKVSLKSNYNSSKNTLDLSESNFFVNDLELELNGRIQEIEKGFTYDVNMQSRDQEFGNLLSIINALNHIPKTDLKADGQFSIIGKIRGTLNEKNTYPKYKLSIDTDGGSFYLPDDQNQELTLDVIAKMSNNDSKYSFTVVTLEEFVLTRNHEKVKGTAEIERDGKNINVVYDLDAKIDDIQNFNTLIDFELYGGKIHLLSKGDFDINNGAKDFRNVNFNVDWEAENVDFLMDSIRVYSSASEGLGDQKSMTINFGHTNFGKSDIRGDIIIKKPLYFLKETPSLSFITNLKSDFIDLNEFFGNSDTTSNYNNLIQSIQADIELSANTVQYRGLPFTNVKLKGELEKDKFTIEELKGEVDKSDFVLTGKLKNVDNYINANGALDGTIDVTSKRLDLDKIEALYYDDNYDLEQTSSTVAFENIDLKIIANIGTLNYGNTHVNENLVSLNLKDNHLKINDYISNSFGGKLNVKGDVIFGQNKSKVELKTDFQNISISQSLESLPLFKKLSYPLSFLNGRINTTLSLSTGLYNDNNFILPEVNAFALLETLDGKISGFEPLEKLITFLGLNNKKDLAIKQSKNWVTIQDGWVQVEEFNFSIDDYHFKVKGGHSLENKLNYKILVEVPSAKISKINIEDHVNPKLLAQLNKYRSVQKGHIGLLFEMRGSMNKPTLKLNQIDIISAGKALVDQTIQDVKDSIRTKVDTLKSQVEEKLRDTLDVLVNKSEEKIGTMIDSAKVIFTDEIKDKIDSTLFHQLDSIGGDVLKDNKTLDSLKSKIFDLKGIFRKK